MNPRDLFRELCGIALTGVGAFLLAALLSFDARDLPAHMAPARAEPLNLGGPLGAYLGAELLRWVGVLGAFGAALLTLAAAVSCLRRTPPPADGSNPPLRPWRVEPLRRLAGACLAILALAAVERAFGLPPWRGVGFPPGGYWGVFLDTTARSFLGGPGGTLALNLTLLTGLALTIDRPLDQLFVRPPTLEPPLPNPNADDPDADDLADDDPSDAPSGDPSSRHTASPVADLDDDFTPDLPAQLDPSAPDPSDDTPSDEAPQDPTPEPKAERTPTPAPKAAIPPTLVTTPPPSPLPSLDLLAPADPPRPEVEHEDQARCVEETLAQFKVSAEVVAVERGPAVTQFALELGKGVKVQRVAGLLDNLALALRVPGIRLEAPIPGTGWVGLEVPNEESEVVRLRELIEHPGWADKSPALPVFLGKDSTGRPLIADLAKMPHLLIAGATGSGKSVCINTIITSLLMTRTPDEVRMILIDPKQVELAQFADVPHLLAPVVTDMRKAGAALDWAVNAMEERYTLLARAKVRHIKDYNKLGPDGLTQRLALDPDQLADAEIPTRLPYVVVVVDELNDLMMIAQKEVEASITRLAQKSRAVGIHVVLATQRPSVDVITGVIKSNLPSRIAFRVASKVDSRTILDASGADKLLGHGDMLFLPPGRNQPLRALGAYVSDDEVQRIVNAVGTGDPAHHEPALTQPASADDDTDPLYLDAARLVLLCRKGSVSLLQRKLGIGYGRAARIMDELGDRGVVGPARGSKPRKVLLTLEAWEAAQADAA